MNNNLMMVLCRQNLLDYKSFDEWFNIVKPVLNNEEFLKRKFFLHHKTQSLYEHSLLVSVISYKLAVRFHGDRRNCALAGLLHDFYTRAWLYSRGLEKLDEKYRYNFIGNNGKHSFFKKHGFTHPLSAVNNSLEYFPWLVNKRIINAIATHMFPLSLFTSYKIPKYKESFIVSLADKIVTFRKLAIF